MSATSSLIGLFRAGFLCPYIDILQSPTDTVSVGDDLNPASMKLFRKVLFSLPHRLSPVISRGHRS